MWHIFFFEILGERLFSLNDCRRVSHYITTLHYLTLFLKSSNGQLRNLLYEFREVFCYAICRRKNASTKDIQITRIHNYDVEILSFHEFQFYFCSIHSRLIMNFAVIVRQDVANVWGLLEIWFRVSSSQRFGSEFFSILDVHLHFIESGNFLVTFLA